MGGHTTNLKVSSKSAPHSVAGALAGVLREHESCEVQVIGAGALNQAIKALAIARTYLYEDTLDLICVPVFAEVEIDGQQRTAIRLVVERRGLDASKAVPRAGLTDFADQAEREVPGGMFNRADDTRRQPR